MFYDTPLCSLDEAALQLVQQLELPEGERLDFKQQIDLSTEKDKREAAKDICAMANSVGGRIIYGMEEKPSATGHMVAGRIRSLPDASVADQLVDVIAGTVHPRRVSKGM